MVAPQMSREEVTEEIAEAEVALADLTQHTPDTLSAMRQQLLTLREEARRLELPNEKVLEMLGRVEDALGVSDRSEAAPETPADSLSLPERLRALADHMEAGCKGAIAVMPTEELTTTMKMVEDFRSAADQLDAFDKLLADCIGAEPVRELAEGLQEKRRAADAAPPGPSLDWIREAGS